MATPQKIARNFPQWSGDLQAYAVSNGDNTIINRLSNLFTKDVAFDLAGDLSDTMRTFADYAATLITYNAHEASIIQTQRDYQKGLHEALALKSAEISAPSTLTRSCPA